MLSHSLSWIVPLVCLGAVACSHCGFNLPTVPPIHVPPSLEVMPKKLSVDEQWQRAQAHEVRGVALRLEAKKVKVMSVLSDPFFLEPIFTLVESLETEKAKSATLSAPSVSSKVESHDWCEQYNKPKLSLADYCDKCWLPLTKWHSVLEM